jgi:hypothetical protein
VTSCKPQENPDKGWRLLRILSGKRPHQSLNQPIFFGSKCYSKPASITNKFCKQFTSVSGHTSSPNARCVNRNIEKKHHLDPLFKPFSTALTEDAIVRSSNSTAVGPDGLTSVHLKYLSLLGLAYLTKLFNLSVTNVNIPAAWKKANIIPIPKPGKPANQSTGYRLISLLSLAVKVLERLLLPILTDALPCAPSQHGYRPMHSFNTALLPIVTKIAIGFNELKPASRTALVALDISKAFDAVDHDLLLGKVSDTQLHSNIVRWLKTYLRGRTALCVFQGAISKEFKCHSGVLQGSVISPRLFTFFVHDFPHPAEVNEAYADDFHVAELSPDADTLGPVLTEHMKEISELSRNNKLGIAPNKSSVRLFPRITSKLTSIQKYILMAASFL